MEYNFDEIVKEIIYRKAKGEKISSEEYVNSLIANKSKEELTEILTENGVFFKKSDNAERLRMRIVGFIVNVKLGYKILANPIIDKEPNQTYYKRLYVNYYDF